VSRNGGTTSVTALPERPSLLMTPDADIVAFITTEAVLADEHRYEEWEMLWADEARYWVCGPGDCDDPEAGFRQASFIYDNRARIASRVRQLRTHRRLGQVPASELNRVVSTMRLASAADPDEVACWANFVLALFRVGRLTMWSGRTLYRLRREPDRLSMLEKRVVLVNRAAPLDTFTFIL
jgi:benzoate/toluate 1,2-dioxygenase subunit beta